MEYYSQTTATNATTDRTTDETGIEANIEETRIKTGSKIAENEKLVENA